MRAFRVGTTLSRGKGRGWGKAVRCGEGMRWEPKVTQAAGKMLQVHCEDQLSAAGRGLGGSAAPSTRILRPGLALRGPSPVSLILEPGPVPILQVYRLTPAPSHRIEHTVGAKHSPQSSLTSSCPRVCA